VTIDEKRKMLEQLNGKTL